MEISLIDRVELGPSCILAHEEAAESTAKYGVPGTPHERPRIQPPPHAQAILPRGRRSEAVNGMAHQVFDQGRSESRVSRQEVTSSCGFSLPLGPVLPSCVWMTSATEETVDGVTKWGVRSETGKKKLFHQRDDGLAHVRSRGTPPETSCWGQPKYPAPLRGAKRFKMGRPPHNSG
jgi:hypothetical protein